MVRWAAIEAISRNHGGDKIKADYRRIAERGCCNIGRVAAGATAEAPAVAVICGGGRSPASRSPEHAVAPAALVDAVLAAVGV